MIAEAAGITRGAMLYHFATREDLLEAVIEHIQAERLALFDAAAADPPPGVDATAHAIAAYWRLLAEPPFVAFAELEAVARTDPTVRDADRAGAGGVRPGAGRRAVLGASPRPARARASRPAATSRRFLLEGLARANLTYERDGARRTT